MTEPMPTCPFCETMMVDASPAFDGKCPDMIYCPVDTCAGNKFPMYPVTWEGIRRGVAAAVQEAFQDGFGKGESHAEKSIPVIDDAVKAAVERCCNELLGNGCFSGDCPHDNVNDCVTALREHITTIRKGARDDV